MNHVIIWRCPVSREIHDIAHVLVGELEGDLNTLELDAQVLDGELGELRIDVGGKTVNGKWNDGVLRPIDDVLAEVWEAALLIHN